MEKFFTISEAAQMAHVTPETLRHYDRIGLVKPQKRDEWSGYRYYSPQDIVRLNTVCALRYMDLPLKEIQRVLSLDDLNDVVCFLAQAEAGADRKIARLQYARQKIARARSDYEKKLSGQTPSPGQFIQELPQRAILLSDHLTTPSLDSLWQYLHPFYDQIPEALRPFFAFEDRAGIYTRGTESRLFATCVSYRPAPNLTLLPAGSYLCANCSEAERERVMEQVLRAARDEHGVEPEFSVQLIIVSGILQWNYQIQLPLRLSPVADNPGSQAE